MSLFTSLPPTAHSVHNASPRLTVQMHQLADNRLTLPQVLRRAGWFNSAVACGGQILAAMGFQRGFEDRFTSELVDVSVITDRSLAAADAALRQDKPWLLFVHTYQVHGPYLPPRAFRERFAPELHGTVGDRVRKLEDLPFGEQWKAMFPVFWKDIASFDAQDIALLSQLYDGEVAYADQEIGRLLDGLRERGVLDRAIVVVVSDHGEEFGEHGHLEHDELYGELLHVPLIVRLPGGALGGTRVTGPCSLMDVMPTLLELVGLQGPDTMGGRSLVPAMQSGRTAGDTVLAERIMFEDAYMAALRTPDTNMLSALRLTKRVLPDMIAGRWGRIVNVTSFSVREPYPNLVLSNGARGGLTGAMSTIAREVAAHGVTINNVLPGLMDTGALKRVYKQQSLRQNISEDDARKRMAESIPAKRLGGADDFGPIVAFLCSRHAAYITAQNVTVDGGLVRAMI